MSLLIRNAILADPAGPHRADILCRGGRIVAIGRDLDAPGADLLDADGLTAGPGFIDVHVHGGGGHSFFTDAPEAVRAYAAWAPARGVTAFLVSTAAPSHAALAARLAALLPGFETPPGAAEPLGYHLEGPWLSPARRGAFPPDYLRRPSIAEFEALHAAAAGRIRQVTIAPELPGALPLIHTIARLGAIPAMGHTDATITECRQGFEAGIRHVTHLFNAMRPFHQREGGPIVAALEEPSATCELIFDGAHVEPDVLRLAWRLLGPHRTVMVTDNLHLAGTAAPGDQFAGERIIVRGARAQRPDGTIVGSVATFDVHLRNAVDYLGIDLPTAFRLASTNPARIAGAGDRKGQLEPGFDADIVLLDRDLAVAATVCRGVIAYRRG
ncbi:N-acetylglucosamine-6-phosphate deacetylase [Tepidiforma flava]|uniref:N-acetylglucosamine-6-phosphate deacetylase n=1 Tax=Tepidiforma flava TaxID=3004094 RepID=A0ABY7M4F2_9CHLR|nr:N-acetylglucosamine-6-phosphate deacetylase [Tepidiforma flava]WBL35037.1 N-acetylglucosamine-6-phosphate deacetylase [Tepidiforma flava]